MNSRSPDSLPIPGPLLWLGAGAVAVACHLVLIQQGLAVMGMQTAPPPPPAVIPEIEIMAVALSVAGQEQVAEVAAVVQPEALTASSSADRAETLRPSSAQRLEKVEAAGVVAASPVAKPVAVTAAAAVVAPAVTASVEPAQAVSAATTVDVIASATTAATPETVAAAETVSAATIAPTATASTAAETAATAIAAAPAAEAVAAVSAAAVSAAPAAERRPAARVAAVAQTAPQSPGLSAPAAPPAADSATTVVGRVASAPIAGSAAAASPNVAGRAPVASSSATVVRRAPSAVSAPSATSASSAARVASVASSAPARSLAPVGSSATVAAVAATPEPPPTISPLPESPAAPAPDTVALLPPSDSTVDQSGVAAPTPENQPTAPANETTYLSVLDVLAEVPKGPCFAALPTLSDQSEFQLEAFAQDSRDLDQFRAALDSRLGRTPNTTMKAISDPQCAAMSFISDGPAYPNFKLFFEIDQRVIKSGDSLVGRIGNATGGFISFLLIDDEGKVQDLGGFLKFVRGGANFSIPLSLTAGPVETQQLLMAISTPARLQTVTDANGQKAADYFPLLAAELLRRGQTEDVALVAFSVR